MMTTKPTNGRISGLFAGFGLLGLTLLIVSTAPAHGANASNGVHSPDSLSTVGVAGGFAPVFVSTTGGVIPAGTNGLSHDVATINVGAALALANTGQHFVFVGNSQGSIDLTGGGASGFSLRTGQSISSFDNGNVITDGSGQLLTSDNVVATNSNAAAQHVITIGNAGGNQISNLSMSRIGTVTTVIAISNVAIASVELTNLSIENFNRTAILLDGNFADVTLLNVDLVDLILPGPATGTALNITGANHAGQITVGSGSDLGNTTGTVIASSVMDHILRLDTSAAHIASANNTQNVIDVEGLAAGSLVVLGLFTVDGAIGDNVIKIGSMTGGSIFLQDVLITNFGDQPTDTAIEILGSGITAAFGELSVGTTNGKPLRIATTQ